MNIRATFHYIGLALKMEALFMLVPLAISAYDGEFKAARGFSVTIVIMILISLAINLRFKTKGTDNIYFKEGFVLVAICWISVSVFGALPFWLSGEIPSLPDAIFESVSGFTTTGASILTSIESISRGILFWCGFTHWIGGMGVLVFLLAVGPYSAGERTLNVLKAESPGPAPEKLVPRLRHSAGILYGIYFSLTLLHMIFLLAGGMPLFDSIIHAMATAGTGGFSTGSASIGAYDSAYIEAVITIFMILFGINLNMYYFLLTRNFRAIWKSGEIRTYLSIIAVSAILITWNLSDGFHSGILQAMRNAIFNVVSVITTTGYVICNFSVWPGFSKAILFFLMITGACAGSTSGGLKVSRVMILFSEARRRLYSMTHPRSVELIKLNDRTVDKTVVHAVNTYLVTMSMIVVSSILMVSADGFDFETTVTAVIACIGNVGRGFGMVGPDGNFSSFSVFSKIILMLDMLIGRLEIYPVLLLFAPQTWKKV